jgi:hypothetical protein
MGHHVLQSLAQGKTEDEARTDLAKLTQEYIENAFDDDVVQIMTLSGEIFPVAVRAWKKLMEFGYTPILSEHQFSVTYDGIPFQGTVDLVLKDKDGAMWIVDHKFREKFKSPESEYFNLQMAIYQKVMLDKGLPVVGSLQYQIYPYAPAKPTINKDGSVSRAACSTDWDTYRQTVIEAGKDPDDYEQMKNKLETKKFEDAHSLRAFRSREELERVWSMVVMPVAKSLMIGNIKRIPIMSYPCMRCDYRELCTENLKGGDTEYIKSFNFHKIGSKPKKIQFEDDT